MDRDSNGLYEACSTCKEEGFVKLGLNDGTGYCRACNAVISDCQRCADYDTCAICKPGYYPLGQTPVPVF